MDWPKCAGSGQPVGPYIGEGWKRYQLCPWCRKAVLTNEDGRLRQHLPRKKEEVR